MRIQYTVSFFLAIILTSSAGAKGLEASHGRYLLSAEGSGRATAYVESPKVVSYANKVHVAWLDSPAEGFRVRARTLDKTTGNWSETYTIGEAQDNHGGPALTIDGEGYLHILFYSHHHPFRYRKSIRPNDASEWTDYQEFGENLTYPALVCAKDNTLIMTARRSFEDRPWVLEMWTKSPKGDWERKQAILQSRHLIYSQFGASLAWGPNHQVLHLGTRIYEMPVDDMDVALTTVGYLKSVDGGETWMRSDGQKVELPATPETVDVITSARGVEGRNLHIGSIDVSKSGLVHIPYGIRIQDSGQAYLATPTDDGSWRQRNLNPFLPSQYREWDLFMHGGISFGSSGNPVLLGTIMNLSMERHEWGEPTTEVVRFTSEDSGLSWNCEILDSPDSEIPRWMPNVERNTGYNEVPLAPGFIYTDGVRGETLDDQLKNEVWWVPGKE